MSELSAQSLAALPIPALLVDEQHHPYGVNAAATDALGWGEVVPTDWRDGVVHGAQLVLTDGLTADLQTHSGRWLRAHRAGALITLTPIDDLKPDQDAPPRLELGPQPPASARSEYAGKLLKTIAQISPVGIFRNDHTGRLVWQSDAVDRMAGQPMGGSSGDDWSAVLLPEDFERVRAEWIAVVTEGRPFSSEYRFIHPDGTVVWVLGQAHADRDEHGEITGYVGTLTDITAQKTTERELKRCLDRLENRTQEIEQVLHITSHDLRSPLVNVAGFSHELRLFATRISELIVGAELPANAWAELTQIVEDDLPTAVGFIHASAMRMSTLLDGLLRISRYGRRPHKPTTVDVGALIETLGRSMRFQLDEAQATIIVGPIPTIYGDEEGLLQVLSNLLDNAIKYRQPDRPLRVQIAGTLQDGRVSLTVRDNGIGIAKDHLDRVFDIFHRVRSAEAVDGEGLGLAVVRRIVDRNAGTIELTSTVGEGSVFTLDLPAQP